MMRCRQIVLAGLAAGGMAAAAQPVPPRPPLKPGEIERIAGLAANALGDPLSVPTVIRDGARYRAWYVVRQGRSRYAVHHAVSADGKTFTDDQCLFWGDRPPCRISSRPAVYKVKDGWRMVLAVHHAVKEGYDAIVLLKSPDGLAWGEAKVLASGSRDYRRPAVVPSGREWWLFYERLDRDPRSTESRYYRLESRDGDDWGGEQSLLTDRTRQRAGDAATLALWYDRSTRRWCLLSSEPRAPGRHLLVLRLSEDGRKWKEGAGLEVTLGPDPAMSTTCEAHAFLDDGGRTWAYYGLGPDTLWRARVDLQALVRDAINRR